MSEGVPSRTITLLFSDIEESTRLLREVGEGYAELLAEHRRVMREAFALSNGREVDTQGDAFFCVFDSVHDAVAAAAAAQRALSGPDWPLQTRVRVRIGIDTGEPSPSDDSYIGLAVHRAARICSAANGGQVLLSAASTSVLGEEEVPGTAVHDLGEHRLKDFDRPERLYQLLIDGLPSDLRPPRQDAEAEGRLVEVAQAAVKPAAHPSKSAGEAVRRWARSFPGASRRRASVESMGLRFYALRALAPQEDLADRLKTLGAALARAGAAMREADDFLARYDRQALAHELHDRRAAAISAADGRRVDKLTQTLGALDALRERRWALSREVRTVEGCEDEIRSDLFSARVGHVQLDALASRLVSMHADIEAGVAALQQELANLRSIATSVPSPGHRRRRRLHLRFWPGAEAPPAAHSSPALNNLSRRVTESFLGRSRRQ